MFELFKEELDSNTYECVEDFNTDVLAIGTELNDELNKVERLILKKDPDVLADLGVSIKGMESAD